MTKIAGMMLLLIGISSFAMATPTPEISVGAAGNALALLSGAVLVIRGRRKN
jgi:hypothetical protein